MPALPSKREPFLHLVRPSAANATSARPAWSPPATYTVDDTDQAIEQRAQRCGSYCNPAVLEALTDLESILPVLAGELGESALFWQALCERISIMEDMAGSDGWMHVNREVDLMLERLGIDPGGWSGFFDA